MRLMKSAAALLLGLCMLTTNAAAQQDCDCARWPWEPPRGCNEVCRLAVVSALDSYTYVQSTEFPRANFMASAAAEEIYGQGFPVTEFGLPVPSSTLYDDPERFGWTDVSSLASKEGAIAVWPTMSGLVVGDDTGDSADGQETIEILYPSHMRDGELVIGDSEWLGEGATPRFLVPTSALEDTIR